MRIPLDSDPHYCLFVAQNRCWFFLDDGQIIECSDIDPLAPGGGSYRFTQIRPDSGEIPLATAYANKSVAVAFERDIVVFNLSTMRSRQVRPHFPVSALAFSPQGDFLAVGGSEGQVSIYSSDLSRVTQYHTWFPMRTITALLYVRDDLLISGDMGGDYVAWHPRNAQPFWSHIGHSDDVITMALVGGHHLALAHFSGVIQLAHIETGEVWWQERIFKGIPQLATAGNLLAVGDEMGVASVWALYLADGRHQPNDTVGSRHVFYEHASPDGKVQVPIISVALSPDPRQRLIASGGARQQRPRTEAVISTLPRLEQTGRR